MKQQNIDKLFRDKLGNREIEFDDRYWQSAEALIDQEKNGKKRRFLGFFFWLGLVILVSSLGVYFVAFDKDTNHNSSTILVEDNPNNSIEFSKKTKVKEDSISSMEENKTLLNENKNSINKYQKNKNSISNSSDSNQDNFKNQPNLPTSSSKSKPLNDSGFLNQINDFNFHKNIDFKSSVSDLRYNSATGKIEKVEDEKTTLFQQMKRKSKQSIQLNTIFNEANDKVEIIEPIATVGALKQRINLLEIEKHNLSLPMIKLDFNQLKKDYPNPPKSHRWNLQAYAGIGVLPNKKNNDESIGNYFGGLSFGYKIQPKISLHIGMSYRQTNANFKRTEGSRQVSYGFGKQDNIFYLQAENLRFIEVPILGSYHLKNSRFSIGISTGRLIAAEGNIIEATSQNPWERTQQENEDFLPQLALARDNNEPTPVFRTESEGESGWISTDNFNQWQINLLGQYQFAVNRKFDLGIGVEYRLQSEFLKDGSGEYSPFSVQFFTAYKIFN